MSDEASPPSGPAYRNSDKAPFVYFDIAPAFGVLSGAIQIELASRTIIPTTDPLPILEFVTTARLRCSPAAALELRNALDKCLQMLEAPSGAPAGSALN